MKNVVQQCEAIDFVFAGDIKPHKETQKFLSLKMSLQPIYLGPLNNYEAKALIQAPLRDYLTYEEPALERMLELTGCKPSLIQILCDDIFELLNLNESKRACITIDILDKLWETDLRNRVFEKFDPVLREFFDGLQGDERNLFCFLAHNPQSTADDISRILGISPSNVNSCLQRLLLAQKIIKDKNVYKISSGIIQEYGSLFLSCPVNNQFKINIFSLSLSEMLVGESSTIEYKSSMQRVLQTKQVNTELERSVAKSIAAFLNSEGGVLLIGVADDRTIVGIEYDFPVLHKKDIDGYQLKLQDLLSTKLGPEFCLYQRISFEESQGKTVCIVRVQLSPRPVFMTDQSKQEICLGHLILRRLMNIFICIDLHLLDNFYLELLNVYPR